MISGANENELEIANARAGVLLSINDDRQHLLGLIKYWEKECLKQDKQLKAYENMRKEAIKLIDYYGITPEQNDNVILRHILKDLLDILKKVGEDNETV